MIFGGRLEDASAAEEEKISLGPHWRDPLAPFDLRRSSSYRARVV
jgi:hypothetical protein